MYSKSAKEHLDHLRKVLSALREKILYIKKVKCVWAKRETEYLGFTVGSGVVRTSPSKVTTIKNWPLPETHKKLKLLLLSNRLIVHLFTTLQNAPLTGLCRQSLPGRVVHSNSTRVAFETLKARMIPDHVLLIPKYI